MKKIFVTFLRRAGGKPWAASLFNPLHVLAI
jgi:hypothetical protein